MKRLQKLLDWLCIFGMILGSVAISLTGICAWVDIHNTGHVTEFSKMLFVLCAVCSFLVALLYFIYMGK